MSTYKIIRTLQEAALESGNTKSSGLYNRLPSRVEIQNHQDSTRGCPRAWKYI
jgi:hypothetical protein